VKLHMDAVTSSACISKHAPCEKIFTAKINRNKTQVQQYVRPGVKSRPRLVHPDTFKLRHGKPFARTYSPFLPGLPFGAGILRHIIRTMCNVLGRTKQRAALSPQLLLGV